jgi:hypothetical protein
MMSAGYDVNSKLQFQAPGIMLELFATMILWHHYNYNQVYQEPIQQYYLEIQKVYSST